MQFFKASILLLLQLSVFINAQAQNTPRDFHFNFKWGYSKRDQIIYDSKNDSLSVNVPDSILRFKITLTKIERQDIYKALQEINFMSLPEKYIPQIPDTMQPLVGSPCRKYFLTVTIEGNSNLVQWNDCVQLKINIDPKYDALLELGNMIEKTIWSRNPLKDYHSNKMWIDPY